METVQKLDYVRFFPADVAINAGKHQGYIDTAIAKLSNEIAGKVLYNMNGAMKATTIVTYPDKKTVREFSTSNGMHSEMVAVNEMLRRDDWILNYGRILWYNNTEIKDSEFKTIQPHCGFCTIILKALGLPLTAPTIGKHHYASSLKYPLPDKVKKDPRVLARILGHEDDAFPCIKVILNSFVNAKPEQWLLQINDFIVVNDHHRVAPDDARPKVSWQEVEKPGLWKPSLLDMVWESIFKSICQLNPP